MTLKTLKPMLLTLLITAMAFSQTLQPFYPNGRYSSAIQSPDAFLGMALASRPVRVHEITHYLHYLAETSPRARLLTVGKSVEGRPLHVLFVSTPDRIAQLDQYQSEMAALGDPRQIEPKAAERLIEKLPVMAWMMYNVHGNELSGSEAALQLAYQLTAGTDEATLAILDSVVVAIDPTQNPDGRERTLAQVSQWTGQVLSHDNQSMEHSGVWPGGRSNHYLFDLNRDWFIGAQPESRAKVQAMARYNPQLVVDAHEMGAFSSYFFNPPREPVSHHIPSQIKAWWDVFAADQARAFDRYSWSYYTADSFDEWYPGYGSSWAFGLGAVAILYEQARTAGASVKRPEGNILTFREAVHHQFTSSMANLSTAAHSRKKLLRDFYAMRSEAVTFKKNQPRAFVLLQGKNPTRAHALAATLVNQGIEVETLTEHAKFSQALSYWNATPGTLTAPKGSFIIRMDQPLSTLALAILEFDVRLNNRLLAQERKALESGKGTRMYEVGAWSMPLAYGVPTVAAMTLPALQTTPWTARRNANRISEGRADYGYLLPWEDDSSVHALKAAFDAGLTVHAATKPFTLNRVQHKRGTLLFRRHDNTALLDSIITRIANASGAAFLPAATALTESGANLGNGSFRLLEQPRVALVAGSGVSSTNLGALWHFLDAGLEMRTALLDINGLGRTDLRKYNVLIFPSSGSYKRLLGKQGIQRIRDWINHGGTLIAIGDAAAALTDSTLKLSQVRLRRQVLKKLDEYKVELAWEADAGKKKPDSLAVWGTAPFQPQQTVKAQKKHPRNLAQQDKQQRLFRPRGSFMRINLHPEHWLGFGVDGKLPALIYTDKAYLSKRPVETAARLADEKHLRLSGLAWPEARARWAQSAYLTRERLGKGQLILFSNDPIFRGYTFGTARLLVNAVLLGPGLGARAPVPW